MDLFALLRLIVRRWWVVVPVIAITVGALAQMVSNRSADYQVQGTYLLLGSSEGAAQDPAVATEALGDLLARPSIAGELAADGLSSTYDVSVGRTLTSLRLVIDAETPELTVSTAERVIEIADELLGQTFQQGGTPTVTARVLTTPQISDTVAAGNGYRLTSTLVVSPVETGAGNPFPASSPTVQTLMVLATAARRSDQRRICLSRRGLRDHQPGSRGADDWDLGDCAIAGIGIRGLPICAGAGGRRLGEVAGHQQRGTGQPNRATPIVEPSVPFITPASVVRPAAGVVLLSCGFAVALAALADALVTRRTGKRGRGSSAGRTEASVAEASGLLAEDTNGTPSPDADIGVPVKDSSKNVEPVGSARSSRPVTGADERAAGRPAQPDRPASGGSGPKASAATLVHASPRSDGSQSLRQAR